MGGPGSRFEEDPRDLEVDDLYARLEKLEAENTRFKATAPGWQEAIKRLYREAERLRDMGDKKQAAVFAQAACFLELGRFA